MKIPGSVVLLVFVLIVLSGGCMQQSSVSAPTSSGTQVPAPVTMQVTPSPCVSCNPTPGMTPTTPGISQGSSPGPHNFEVPTADFIANRTSGRSPLVIGFSDRSYLSPMNWSWDFGDGSISNTENPLHVYKTPGTYSVRLNVSNEAGGTTAAKIYYITVMPEFQAPVASFGLIPQESPSGVLQFTDRSYGPPTNWSWNFGDGATSYLQNPVHSFTTPGNYLVSLIVSNPSGTSSVTRELVFGGSP